MLNLAGQSLANDANIKRMRYQMKQIFRLLSLTTLVLMGFTTSAWALPLTFTLIGVDNPALRAEVRFEYLPSGIINIDITNTSLIRRR